MHPIFRRYTLADLIPGLGWRLRIASRCECLLEQSAERPGNKASVDTWTYNVHYSLHLHAPRVSLQEILWQIAELHGTAALMRSWWKRRGRGTRTGILNTWAPLWHAGTSRLVLFSACSHSSTHSCVLAITNHGQQHKQLTEDWSMNTCITSWPYLLHR